MLFFSKFINLKIYWTSHRISRIDDLRLLIWGPVTYDIYFQVKILKSYSLRDGHPKIIPNQDPIIVVFIEVANIQTVAYNIYFQVWINRFIFTASLLS